jgi:branched-subunit amino acid aminotransferase/4-amino-4-deoxychorismate lyase
MNEPLNLATNAFFWNEGLIPHSAPLGLGTERTFLNGEGLFETVFVQEKPLFLDRHLRRMAQSAKELHYPSLPQGWDALEKQLKTLVSLKQGRLRILFSTGPQHHSPFEPLTGPAHLFASLSPYDRATQIPPQIQVRLQPHLRSAFARYKSTSNAENCWWARQKKNYYELLFCQEGFFVEGISHNFFFFQGDRLCTPSHDLPLLPGITREILLEIWPYKTQEARFPVDTPLECPFLCNALVGLVPIHTLEGATSSLSWKNPEPFVFLQECYQRFMADHFQSVYQSR